MEHDERRRWSEHPEEWESAFTLPALARFLGVSLNAVRRWMETGILHSLGTDERRAGHPLMISRRETERFRQALEAIRRIKAATDIDVIITCRKGGTRKGSHT